MNKCVKANRVGTSLVVQWQDWAVSAGSPGLIPDQGARPHMPQLKRLHGELKGSECTTKTLIYLFIK